jgi:hypothetical protein
MATAKPYRPRCWNSNSAVLELELSGSSSPRRTSHPLIFHAASMADVGCAMLAESAPAPNVRACQRTCTRVAAASQSARPRCCHSVVLSLCPLFILSLCQSDSRLCQLRRAPARMPTAKPCTVILLGPSSTSRSMATDECVMFYR